MGQLLDLAFAMAGEPLPPDAPISARRHAGLAQHIRDLLDVSEGLHSQARLNARQRRHLCLDATLFLEPFLRKLLWVATPQLLTRRTQYSKLSELLGQAGLSPFAPEIQRREWCFKEPEGWPDRDSLSNALRELPGGRNDGAHCSPLADDAATWLFARCAIVVMVALMEHCRERLGKCLGPNAGSGRRVEQILQLTRWHAVACHYLLDPSLTRPPLQRLAFEQHWQPRLDALARAYGQPSCAGAAIQLAEMVSHATRGPSATVPFQALPGNHSALRLKHDLCVYQIFDEDRGKLPDLVRGVPEAIHAAAWPGTIGLSLIIAPERASSSEEVFDLLSTAIPDLGARPGLAASRDDQEVFRELAIRIAPGLPLHLNAFTVWPVAEQRNLALQLLPDLGLGLHKIAAYGPKLRHYRQILEMEEEHLPAELAKGLVEEALLVGRNTLLALEGTMALIARAGLEGSWVDAIAQDHEEVSVLTRQLKEGM